MVTISLRFSRMVMVNAGLKGSMCFSDKGIFVEIITFSS